MTRSIVELAAAITAARTRHGLTEEQVPPAEEGGVRGQSFDYDVAPSPPRRFDWWRAFEVVAVLAGLVATFLAWQANELSRQALRDQQISAAWQILANHQPGSTGKQYALGVLLAGDDSVLSSLDLGCERAMPPMRDGIDPDHPVPTRCVDGVDLSRMTVGANLEIGRHWQILNSDFSGVNLGGATFKGGRFSEVNLSEAKMLRTRFVNVDLTVVSFVDAYLPGSKFDGTVLRAVDFRNADLTSADFYNASFDTPANITGAKFCFSLDTDACVKPGTMISVAPEMTGEDRLRSQQKLLRNAWYWDDDPPTGVAPSLLQLAIRCDAAKRYSTDTGDQVRAVCRSEPGLAGTFVYEQQ